MKFKILPKMIKLLPDSLGHLTREVGHTALIQHCLLNKTELKESQRAY